MTDHTYVGQPIPRPDGWAKAAGELRFPSDHYPPGCLVARVLRSAHPHALIRSLDVGKAREIPGVVAVLTHQDVPGLNGYGIAIQDMPVLCHDKVRYVGDAVALVGAESEEAAQAALDAIQVEYEPLPVVTDPETAMQEEAPLVHEQGNLLHQAHLGKGDVEVGFAEADEIVQGTWQTQFMDHGFLETESGYAYLDGEVLTVVAGGQYAFRDQAQIARSLDLPMERIRVIDSVCGGAFGGKDEVTVQILLALLTWKTRRPCRMHWSREEHFLAGMKRHPVVLEWKLGALRDGRLTALQARAVSDAGAYASLSEAVLNLVVEHATGPYLIPHVKVDAYAVYTNNGFSAAYRGFGATQACVAIEGALNELARRLELDPLELRLTNGLRRGDQAGLGYEMVLSVGIRNTLEAALRHPLWTDREELKRTDPSSPGARFKRRGIGVASEMQGSGLGVGLPDYATGLARLRRDGRFEVRSGIVEIGQGAYVTVAQMAAEVLRVDPGEIEVILGDTGTCPDAGTTTASRGVYVSGNSVAPACRKLVGRLIRLAAEATGLDAEGFRLEPGRLVHREGRELTLAELADLAESRGVELEAKASFIVPTAAEELGYGLPHILYSYITQIALVEVDLLTGQVEVLRVAAFPDAGKVINPQALEGQSEGGVIMGMGYALYEENLTDQGRALNPDFTTYVMPTAVEAPLVETEFVEVFEETGPYGAKGMGEAVTVPTAPAITEAIRDATGLYFRQLPVTPEKVVAALKESHTWPWGAQGPSGEAGP